MKKILTTLLIVFCAVSVSAQITFWGTAKRGIYDTVTWEKLRDTIVPVPVWQFEYDEIDSITFVVPQNDSTIPTAVEQRGYLTIFIEIPEGTECNGIALKGTFDGVSWAKTLKSFIGSLSFA